MTEATTIIDELDAAAQRYRGGARRNRVFCDLIASALATWTGERPTALDIGCGSGIDGDLELQSSIAQRAGRMIGVEPDAAIETAPCFSEVHRSIFEEAPIERESVHVAYSAFVLEHVRDPQRFWDRLYECLVPRGVFWGITVDARHYFTIASQLLECLRVKDWYLTRLRGERGVDRYENYPTYYRTNSPRRIRRQARRFRALSFATLHRAGQLDYYVPRPLRGLSRAVETVWSALGGPGSVLLIRAEK
jgi:SAM-dependent methyltransferase